MKSHPANLSCSLSSELQEILRCMPQYDDAKCLTEDEHKFFSTIKWFFQAQSGYVCSNKERISEGEWAASGTLFERKIASNSRSSVLAFDKSSCKYMKNRADIQQQCYSLNAQRLSYDWKVRQQSGFFCLVRKLTLKVDIKSILLNFFCFNFFSGELQ